MKQTNLITIIKVGKEYWVRKVCVNEFLLLLTKKKYLVRYNFADEYFYSKVLVLGICNKKKEIFSSKLILKTK